MQVFNFILILFLFSDCTVDDDCPHNFKCKSINSSPLYCSRRTLLADGFSKWDVAATFITFFIALLTSWIGLSGGSLYAPLFILCAGFSIKDAIPIGQSAIVGNLVVSFIFNLIRSHPKDSDKSLIDFLFLQYMLPPVIIGVSLGVFVQIISPNWFVLSVSAIILSYCSIFMTYRAVNRYLEFTQMEAGDKSNSNYYDSEITVETFGHKPTFFQPKKGFLYASLTDSKSKNLEKEYDEMIMREKVYWKHQVIVSFFLFTTILLIFLRGGHSSYHSLTGITWCSNSFWIICASSAFIFCTFMVYPLYRLYLDYNLKVKLDIHKQDGQIQFDLLRVSFLYPLLFFAVGVFSIVGGISGSIFISPILLSLGMLQEVAVATASASVLISSITAIVNYLILNQILLDHAAWYFSISVIGALFGSILLRHFTNKLHLHCDHVVGLAIALILVFACISLIVIGAITLNNDLVSGTNILFRNFCSINNQLG